MKIKKILAGIAFDKETDKILAYTTLFAGTFEASVNLLSVMDYLITPACISHFLHGRRKKDCRNKL